MRKEQLLWSPGKSSGNAVTGEAIQTEYQCCASSQPLLFFVLGLMVVMVIRVIMVMVVVAMVMVAVMVITAIQ